MDFFDDSAKTVFLSFLYSTFEQFWWFRRFWIKFFESFNTLLKYCDEFSFSLASHVDGGHFDNKSHQKSKVKGCGSVNRDKWAAPLSSGEW